MSKSTHQRKARTNVCARSIPASGKALPLRRTWPISLCVGLAVGSIVFSGEALAGGPTGGVVVGGTGSITQGGNSTVINQVSQKLALNWQTFNVGANESVQFNQPSHSAVALNRILDQNPSQIFGRINSNGQIFLINTHGIIFGATAQMNVGGLLASTLDLTPSDFLAGHYNLNVAGAGAGIVNHGLIQAASGGSVALVGGSVLNDGLIFANYGKINLDGADHAVLDFDGNGLINIQITGELKQRLDNREAAVTNKGTLSAEDGTVVLQASAAKDLFTSLVNNAGVIDASGISTDGGVVRLVANGGNVENSGRINVSGVHGGSVQLLSDQNVGVTGSIDASGTLGGGNIRVGGGWQGGEGLQTAAVTYIGPDAILNADAIHSGDGGSVVVWGNQGNNFFGRISARGGAYGGNGGQVETSSHYGLNAQGSVDASAAHGLAGTWLLDPYDVTIGTPPVSGTAWGNPYTPTATSTIRASDVGNALNSGTNVFVFTNTAANGADTGNITVSSGISASGAGSLYLEAVGSILLNANISGKNNANPLGVYLWANYGGAAAGTTYTANAACPTCVVTIGNAANAAITTFGGAVDIRTGDASHAGGAVNIGNGTFTGSIDTSGAAAARGALAVDAAGITQLSAAGNSIVAGAAALNAGSGGISLTNAGNNFSGAIGLTGGNVSLVNNAATVLDTTSATTLNVSSKGALSQTGALTVTGAATFTQNSTTVGATQDINLGSQSNSFQGGVTFAAGTSAGINNLSLKNTVASPGPLTLPASVAGILTLNYTNAAATLAVPLAGITVGGLDLTAGGGITINGNVSTSGAQAYHSAVTLGADATLASTGNGNIGFDSTVNGAYALTVNTGGATSFGGAVGAASALTSLTTDAGGSTTLGGNVTTSGAQTYGDKVALSNDVTLATTNSNVSFNSTVDNASSTARSLTVNAGSGAVTFGGAVGSSVANGALGSLSVNSAGTTSFGSTVQAASLATNAGGGTTLGGNVTTTGAQTYSNAVTLGANAILVSSGNGAIGFGSTVDGAYSLTVNTGGVTSFGGVVGGSTLLSSLTTNAAGSTVLAGNVGTTGAQTYNDAVTLGTDAILTSNGGGAVTFASTVDGAHKLTVNTGGVTSFGGAVGATNALTSLTTDAGGSTKLGGNVSTSGAQTYNDAVTLSGDATLASTGGGDIHLASTVDGAHKLSVNTSGATILGGAVGGTTALTGLTTNSGTFSAGNVTVNGPLSVTTTAGGITQVAGVFTTSGASTFNAGGNAITLNSLNAFGGPVNLTGGTTQITNGGNLTLGTVNTGALTVVSLGALNLGSGSVAGTLAATSNGLLNEGSGGLSVTGLASFTQNGGGASVDLSQANNFQGGVTISGVAINNLSLKNTAASPGVLTLPASVAGNLTLNYTNAALTLPVVGVGGALDVSAGGGITINGNVSTGGAQAYHSAVTLGADAILASTSNGNIGFDSTVNGAHALTVNTGGATSFGGAVGATSALTSLTTDAGGSTTLGGNVTTSGAQTYGDAVTLGVDATLTSNGGGAIGFGSTVIGAHALTVNTGGTISFGGIATLTGLTATSGTFNANALNIGNGGLSVTTSAGGIGQSGAFTVTGTSSFNAGGNAITLTNANNDFTGAVNLSGGTTQITDKNALTLGTLSTGALTAVSTGALNLGAGSIGGNLSATSNNGAISQAGALTVGGASGLNAGSGTIMLTNANNDFVGAMTVAGAGVQIADVNDLSIAALTNGANGAVSLVAGGTLTLPAGAIDTGTANLVLASNGGVLGTPGNLSGQNISLTGHGGLTLSNNVTAAGTLSLTSGAGISQGAGIITAGMLTGSSVGSTVLGQANKIGTLGSFSAANFSLTNAQALTVNGPLATTGDIDLTTTSGALVVNAGVAGHAVALDSAGNLALANNVNGTTVTLTSGGDISQGAGTITAGTLSGSATGSITLDQANKVTALGAFSANGFSLINSQALAVSGPLSGGASTSLTTTVGDLSINGAVSGATTVLKSAGAISQGAGGSLTAGTLSGQSVGATTLNGTNHIGTLGSFTAAGFALTNAQALAVSGPLSGGASTSLTTTVGDLSINGAVSGTTTVLKSAGAITQGAGGSLTAGTLSGQSVGATTLNGINHIGTLGSFSAAGFGLTNAQALAVSGPVNGGASTTLTTTAGDLAINGLVSGTTTVLNSAAAITEGAGGSITANLLTGHSVGNARLDGSNHINTLGGFTSDFSLTNAQTLTVVGPINGGASVSLTTTAGDLVINGAITGSTTTLKSAGAISQGAGGSITAGTLTGQSGGATTLGGTNHIGTLGSFTAAGFGLTNAQALTVTGAVNGGASTTLTTTVGDLAINGAVSGLQTKLSSAGAITEGSGGLITAATLSGSAANGTTLGSAAHRVNNMVDTLGNFSSPAGFSMTNNKTLTLASVAGSAFTVNAGTSAFYLSVTNGDLFQLGTTPVYNGMGVWGSTGRMGTGSAPIYVIGTGLQTIANVGLPPAYFYAIDSSGNLLPLGGGLAVNVPTASGAGSAQNGNHGDSYIDPSVITANYRSYGIVPSGVRLPADQQNGCDPDQPDQLDCQGGDAVGMVGVLMNVRQ